MRSALAQLNFTVGAADIFVTSRVSSLPALLCQTPDAVVMVTRASDPADAIAQAIRARYDTTVESRTSGSRGTAAFNEAPDVPIMTRIGGSHQAVMPWA